MTNQINKYMESNKGLDALFLFAKKRHDLRGTHESQNRYVCWSCFQGLVLRFNISDFDHADFYGF